MKESHLSINDEGLKAQIRKTTRTIMNYSSRSSNNAYSLAEKLHEMLLRFRDNGPQLVAYYCSMDGRVHIVLADLLKIYDPLSLFVPFYNLLKDKKKILTMRITHFLGFAQKKIVYFQDEDTPHEVYMTQEGIMEGEFINHNSDLD